MLFFVDVQGHKYTNILPFTCREIAILNTKNVEVSHKIINPPVSLYALCYKVRQHISYEIANIHGLEWYNNSGNNINDDEENYLDQPKLVRFLHNLFKNIDADVCGNNVPDVVKLIVKGGEKKQWVENLLKNCYDCPSCSSIIVCDLEEIIPDCLNLEAIRDIFKSHHCNKHNLNYLNCAVENVYNLYHYWYLSKCI